LFPYLNVSIALVVFMGVASGGLLALFLMAGRRQEISFAIMFALAATLALLGVVGATTSPEGTQARLANALVLFGLSFALGYALTSVSVLSPRRKKWNPNKPLEKGRRPAVILVAPGEPPEYSVTSAAKRIEIGDESGKSPPTLLRPPRMYRLKRKYGRIGKSPYRANHLELANKVQARLGPGHRVYVAFYADQPALPEMMAQAIEEGAPEIVIANVGVIDPPDAFVSGDLFEGIDPRAYGVAVRRLEPLWSSELLPQVYVRRALEAVPQLDVDPAEVGLLLVGRGQQAANGSASNRQLQEESYQRRVREALVRAGFDETRVLLSWLNRHPLPEEGLHDLVRAGCRSVYWLPSSFPSDDTQTLADITGRLERAAAQQGIGLASLGGWNADDLAAEEIATQVRALVEPSREPAVQSL
jgi:sirohydrochlorin ferrochelatase